jgi:hypothetical protein
MSFVEGVKRLGPARIFPNAAAERCLLLEHVRRFEPRSQTKTAEKRGSGPDT